MTQIEKDQLIILSLLRDMNANIQPVNNAEFQELLRKKMNPENSKSAWMLLGEEGFIKLETSVRIVGFYLVWLTDKGFLYLQTKEIEIKNKKIENLKAWLTPSISIVALIFSGIATFNGCNKAEKEERISKRQEQTEKSLMKIRKTVDSVKNLIDCNHHHIMGNSIKTKH